MTRKRKGPYLPNDYARCKGVGDDLEGWREGCEDCLRRTSPPSNPERGINRRRNGVRLNVGFGVTPYED